MSNLQNFTAVKLAATCSNKRYFGRFVQQGFSFDFTVITSYDIQKIKEKSCERCSKHGVED